MADAAGATPLLPGLPDDIAIWEILIRLPPKPLLRCRAVSPAWRRVTSARDFLLRHHARQPALPLLLSYADGSVSLDITPFDHGAGVAAADRFQSAARLKLAPDLLYAPRLCPVVSCDGLLLFSFDFKDVCICNPATRQYAPLQQLRQSDVVDMYAHPSTGEHRILLYRGSRVHQGAADDGFYVYTIGSDLPLRRIAAHPQVLDCCGLLFHGCVHWHQVLDCSGLLFHGCLHWHAYDRIIVFDTTAESFRQISAPVTDLHARLFRTGDMLGVFRVNMFGTALDIWVMQDYRGEAWDFRRRVALPIAETRHKCQRVFHEHSVMVAPRDGELLVLVDCCGWLFQLDVDGKLIATSQWPRGLISTDYVLKQTLVQHTFFPRLEGYVVNASPFI